jgi:hypothetical protein
MPNYMIRHLGALQLFDYKTSRPEDGLGLRSRGDDSISGGDASEIMEARHIFRLACVFGR